MNDALAVPSRSVAPKRVVVIDDSRSMRMWIRHVLDNDVRLEVVGEAADAIEARAVIKSSKPDVITLDIDMPGMSGLEFLERVMKLHPMPVVMLSAATARGSAATVKSLALGAVDCVVKPQAEDLKQTQRDLVRRVFSAACSRVQNRTRPDRLIPDRPFRIGGPMPIILIGASTGGVAALDCVLEGLNPQGPPVVIVQHMPSEFLISFSEMLNRHLRQDVGMLSDAMVLKPGQVMLAPASDLRHSQVAYADGHWQSQLRTQPQHCVHNPSVDVLFHSAVDAASNVIGVLLTGLGRDGALGLKALRDAGAKTIGQDADSSVVYGMPRAAFELGAVERQLPLAQIGSAVNDLVRAHQLRHVGPGQ